MTSLRYRTLLRTLYTSVLGSRLTSAELRSLVVELRRGRLSDELSFMIEEASRHFDDPNDNLFDDDRIAEAEELVRVNKISRTALASMMQSLGYQPDSIRGTTKSLIKEFLSEMSATRVTKLIDTLRSAGSGDDFLEGISKSRK